MKYNTLIISLLLFAFIPSCRLVDDEFSDTWSDESTKEFESSLWEDIPQNEFAVIGEPNTEAKIRQFPETGELYYAKSNITETAGISFRSTIQPERENPDTEWGSYGHFVCLAIESIPVKVSESGVVRFSKKTQNGTVSFCSLIADMGLVYQHIKDCKVSISGKLTQQGNSLDNGNQLTGNIEIKIISPDNDRWILHYKELTVLTCDMGFLRMYL